MTAADWCLAAGKLFAIIGVLIQFLFGAACNSYEIRRRLPLNAPLQLQGIGCCFFVTGVLLLACRAFLDRH